MRILTLYIINAALFLITACSSCSEVPVSIDEKPIKTLNVDSLGKFGQGTVQKDLYYTILLENYPENDLGWHGKSVSYLKRGNLSEGFRCLNRAVELNPVNNLGYRGWVKLYMFHDYDGALSDFKRLDSLTPSVQDAPWGEDICKLMGICYLELGEFKNALMSFKQAISETERTVGSDWIEQRTLFYYSVALRKVGEIDQALESINNLLEKDPSYPEALFEKASLLQNNDMTLALNLLDSCERNMHEQNTNPYFELPLQLYQSDIDQLKKHIKNNEN